MPAAADLDRAAAAGSAGAEAGGALHVELIARDCDCTTAGASAGRDGAGHIHLLALQAHGVAGAEAG